MSLIESDPDHDKLYTCIFNYYKESILSDINIL